MTSIEVRYNMLRPAQIVARRKECPVAYIPIGTLEWHGVHNPVGADTLQAEGLALLCAERGGGLVFPPLYYGESRLEALMEANAADREAIAAAMELSPDNFLPDRHPFSATEQALNYHKLLLHILAEAESLGFELGVIVAGHYPLIDHARAAAAVFHQTQPRDPRMLVWSMTGFELVRGQFEPCGDHAGKWETSLLMYLDPGMQDLSVLPPKGSDAHIIGVTDNGVQDANAEFGRQAAEAIVEAVAERVKGFLENPTRYTGHGSPM